MATYLSPGVYIEEIDASNIVPNVSNNVAFFAGNFTRGPVNQPYVITNKRELEQTFGTPTDKNYNEWFQCYKFFDYANQLVVTRAFENNTIDFGHHTYPTPRNNYKYLFKLYSDPERISISINGQSEYAVKIITQSDYDFTYSVGDWISLGDIQKDSNGNVIEYVYTVHSIETLPEDNSVINNQIPKRTQVILRAYDVSGSPIDTQIDADIGSVSAGDSVYIHSVRHLNSDTQAFKRGPFDGVNFKPLGYDDGSGNTIYPASSAQNIDYKQYPWQDAGEVRFRYHYGLIKNNEDWDYYDKQLDSNPFRTYLKGDIDSAKLRFISKTPNTDVVKIAIANVEDFRYEDGNNEAIAFSEIVNGVSENILLTDLFSYYPSNNEEIAIALKLGDYIETFVVSFDKDAVDGNNQSKYIENVINEQSKLVYVLNNENIHDMPASYLVLDRFGWQKDQNTGEVLYGTPAGIPTSNLYLQGGRSPLVSIGALKDAYLTVEDKERYEIDVIIGNEFVDGDYDNQNVAIDLASSRKDCIAFIGARRKDCLNKKSQEVTRDVINYIIENDQNKRGKSVKLTRSMFGAFFANYFKIYDKYNKTFRYINVAGDAAGIRCQTSGGYDAWWVSAGVKRGIVKNIEFMAFTPSQYQRDNLYKNGINPIVQFPGTGNLIWGNKTLYPLASSFDRINVRTLFNALERSMSKAARSQVFEFNDAYTRNAILSMFNPYLATIKAGRGIVDYLVVCDETNNTPDVVSRNELRVDIYIKPNYAAEFIILTFTNVGTRSFSSVIGA